MHSDFAATFAALKPILSKYEKHLTVKADSPAGYSVDAKAASPFPQHKGQPMFFGAVRLGKAYVGFHLMPIYMCPELSQEITPALKKRMQGKSCFNFKNPPDPELLADLKRFTEASFKAWREKKWL